MPETGNLIELNLNSAGAIASHRAHKTRVCCDRISIER